jgi:hypothetical protein
MSNFRKKRECPSSFDLADASCGEVDGLRALVISSHIAICDFCAAEVEFYRAYPPEVETAKPPPLPSPLMELAEALLSTDTIHISTLERLIWHT